MALPLSDQTGVRRQAQEMRAHARDACAEAADQRARNESLARELRAQRERLRRAYARMQY